MATELIMKEIEKLSDEKKREIFNFVLFIKTRPDTTSPDSLEMNNYRSIIGRAKTKIVMAPDFNDTPECFKEYV